MIHDIGRIALAVMRPQQYADFLDQSEGEPVAMLDRERELFSMNHCEVGHFLIVTWELPGEFLEIVGGHHTLDPNGPFHIPAAVRAACLLSETLGFGVSSKSNAPPYAELLSQLPPEVSNRLPTDAGEFASVSPPRSIRLRAPDGLQP